MNRSNGRISLVIFITFISVVFYATSRASGQSEGTAEYVGDNAKNCKVCHAEQAKVWSTLKMAKAFSSLNDQQQKDPKCIKCHVTGFGEKTGFKSLSETPKLADVQCEACHGPASLHMKVPINDKQKRRATIKKPTKEDCLKCHNKEYPDFKGFDYEKQRAKIQHWKSK